MAVEKTVYGTWRARWRDHDGRQRSRSFKRKADADRHLASVQTDLARGTYSTVRGDTMTVSAWADQWLAGAHTLAPSTVDTYRRDLDRHILPVLGKLRLRQIRAHHIDELLAAHVAAGTAATSVRRYYATINRMLTVAVRQERLARNPCDSVDPPAVPEKEMRFLTAEQVEALADAITPRYRAWVLVAAYGGLRWSEMVGLRRGRVDGGVLDVREQLVRVAGAGWVVRPVKSRMSGRTVTLPASVTAVLEEHLGEWSQPGGDGLVFLTRNGTPIGSSMRSNVFHPAVKRAGITGRVRPHDLRHTAVALAVAAGAHPKAIQQRMGHASITVTLDRYGHLYPDADAAVAAALDGLRKPLL